MSPAPRFLTVEDVLALHVIAIEDQGGDATVRDPGLLESAVAVPAQQFGGELLHEDVPAIAAAYAFHICMNHPFLDGNKRAATAAMIVFLSDNGWSFDATADEAEPIILRLAAGNLDKAGMTEWVRSVSHQKPSFELRQFLGDLEFERLHRMVDSVVAGGEAEMKATVAEASRAIPLIKVFEGLLDSSRRRNDEAGAARFGAIAILLTAVYRVAEDMGYEW